MLNNSGDLVIVNKILSLIFQEFNDFRSKCGLLWSYDWISIPLVYTQVVTLATYAFFGACIFGRQYVDAPDKPDHNFELYIPIFTIFQLFFYMGLLKVRCFFFFFVMQFMHKFASHSAKYKLYFPFPTFSFHRSANVKTYRLKVKIIFLSLLKDLVALNCLCFMKNILVFCIGLKGSFLMWNICLIFFRLFNSKYLKTIKNQFPDML
ncbi:UNVERIFIED_CONTAM: Best2 [Trichonephila clavipes]